MFILENLKYKLSNIFGVNRPMTDEEFIVHEIKKFEISIRRKDMLTGRRYYEGRHDIKHRKREVIGEDGALEEVKNLPNNKIVDNQYKKMVVQKANYLLGKPLTISSGDTQYDAILGKVFNMKFMRTLKAVGEDSLNCGIGWLMAMYDEKGKFMFKRFAPWEIIPGWKDAEHTELEYIIRVYEVVCYEGITEKIITKVEVYDKSGVKYFVLEGSNLVKDAEPDNYFEIDGIGYNWDRIPFIPFKYNASEIPLINNVKSLQDGLNLIESNFQNQMEEDNRNTIMVLVNYDGENLGEFRRNLATYGAVKVRNTSSEGRGDIHTIQVEVNSENYKTIISLFKKAIIENAMGYDAKDDRLNGNANQLNIKSMYNDIDLDANSMETEYQAAFEELEWFLTMHLYNVGAGDFEDVPVNVTFNRNMLMNETELISDINASIGFLSNDTLIAKHPWVKDPATELERLQKEQEAVTNPYNNA